ncbi:MAG TPA: hypothetical protein VMV73_01880 [Candidatus Dormibacteraeota bacterium]|nr:hypothetical protein [Candidatus Dormibacteraeota bacterium]
MLASVARPNSFPRLLPSAWGARIYRSLDRIAPAPFIERELALDALRNHNNSAAIRYAARMPAGALRDGLFAAVSRARGEEDLAVEYELAGLDLPRVRERIRRLSLRHPRAAYDLAARLFERLQVAPSHPDALADASWRLGVIALSIESQSHRRTLWSARAERALRTAAKIAPYDNTYQLALAALYFDRGNLLRAKRWYTRTVASNPTSVDGWLGLTRIELARGNIAAARRDIVGAMKYAPTSPAVEKLMARLAPTRPH